MSNNTLLKTETYAELYAIEFKRPEDWILLEKLARALIGFLDTTPLSNLIKNAKGFLISTATEDKISAGDLIFFLIFGEAGPRSKDISLRVEDKMNLFKPINGSCVFLKRKRHLESEEGAPEFSPNKKVEEGLPMRRLRSVRGALSHVDKILKKEQSRQIHRVIPLGEAEAKYFLYNYDLVRLNTARHFLEKRYENQLKPTSHPVPDSTCLTESTRENTKNDHMVREVGTQVREKSMSCTPFRSNDSLFTSYYSDQSTPEKPERDKQTNNHELNRELIDQIQGLVQKTFPKDFLKSVELKQGLEQLQEKLSSQDVIHLKALANELGLIENKKHEQIPAPVVLYLVIQVGITVVKVLNSNFNSNSSDFKIFERMFNLFLKSELKKLPLEFYGEKQKKAG